MVTQGNLLALGILFMDDFIFFPFFLKDDPSYFIIVLAVWDWSDKVFQCNNIRFFVGCERYWIWYFFPHIYNSGCWWYGILAFSRNSSLRMTFGEANLKSNNSEQRDCQMGFVHVFQLYNFIPFSSCFKLISKCLLEAYLLLHHHIISPCLDIKSKKIGSHC